MFSFFSARDVSLKNIFILGQIMAETGVKILEKWDKLKDFFVSLCEQERKYIICRPGKAQSALQPCLLCRFPFETSKSYIQNYFDFVLFCSETPQDILLQTYQLQYIPGIRDPSRYLAANLSTSVYPRYQIQYRMKYIPGISSNTG